MKAISVSIERARVRAGVVIGGDANVIDLREEDLDRVRKHRRTQRRSIRHSLQTEVVTDLMKPLLEKYPDVDVIGLTSTGTIDTEQFTVEDDLDTEYAGTNWSNALSDPAFRPYRVHVENDAKAAAWGEYLFWPTRTRDDDSGTKSRRPMSLAHILITAGVGAGIVLDGRLVTGAHLVAGEIGGLPYKANSPTIEEVAGNRGVLRAGRCASISELCAKKNAHDLLASSAVEASAEAIGWGIAAIINIVGPEIITITGELIDADQDYLSLIDRAVRQMADKHARMKVTIAPGILNDTASIIGVAHLAMVQGRYLHVQT